MTRYAFPEGVFHIDPVPGQPQIAHCHGFFVPSAQRGQGKGTVLKQIQMATLRAENFDFATCTVDAENRAQQKILARAGWLLMGDFRNSRTDSITQMWSWGVNNKWRDTGMPVDAGMDRTVSGAIGQP